jgi:hypothetical protein
VRNSRFESIRFTSAASGQAGVVVEQLFYFGAIIIEYRRE